MELSVLPQDVESAPLLPESKASGVRATLRSFLQREGSRTFLAGLLLFCLVAGAALAAPLITDHDPSRNNIAARLRPPFWDTANRGSTEYPLGTDGLGRDMLSRILYGLRVSLVLAVAGLCLSMALGVTLGLVSGLFGGRTDAILMRVVDLQLAFPYIVLAMAIVAATKTSIPILIVLLGLAGWVYFARVVRGVVLQEMQRDYVALGAGPGSESLADRYSLRVAERAAGDRDHCDPAVTGADYFRSHPELPRTRYSTAHPIAGRDDA